MSLNATYMHVITLFYWMPVLYKNFQIGNMTGSIHALILPDELSLLGVLLLLFISIHGHHFTYVKSSLFGKILAWFKSFARGVHLKDRDELRVRHYHVFEVNCAGSGFSIPLYFCANLFRIIFLNHNSL